MVTDIVQFSLGTFLQPLWSSSDVLGPWRDLREDQQGCKQVPCENCMMSVTAFYPSLCVSQIWWILFTSPMVTKVCDIWVSIRRCVSQIWWILFCRFRLRGRTRLQTSCNFRREPFYSLFGPPQMSLAHGGTSGRNPAPFYTTPNVTHLCDHWASKERFSKFVTHISKFNKFVTYISYVGGWGGSIFF